MSGSVCVWVFIILENNIKFLLHFVGIDNLGIKKRENEEKQSPLFGAMNVTHCVCMCPFALFYVI